MKYSNLEIYKELKYIDNCFSGKGRRVIDEIAKEVYKNNNIGLNDFLIENKYTDIKITVSGIKIPYISQYGKDFLKKKWINHFIEDYKWSINGLILFCITIITGILIYILTK